MNYDIPHPYSEVGHYESQYNLKEAHDKFLEVILAFDTFCRKHNIKYSIADGTLLGALRHGDFVPWDDDADVMVTREEYNKIREAIKTDDSIHLVKLRFLDRIILPKYEEEGYYIDLFINDEMPQSKFQFKKKKLVTHFLRCYSPNDAIFMAKPEAYLERKHFFGAKSIAYVMSAEDSVDIDGYLDLIVAKAIME